jgi:hypothetical protein
VNIRRAIGLAVAFTALVTAIAFLPIACHLNPFHSGPGPDPLTADGLTDLLTQTRQKFGDTQGYRLLVYREGAELTRANPENPHIADFWYFHEGGAHPGWDKSDSESPPSDSPLRDLAKFDVPKVVALLADLPSRVGIKDKDVKSKQILVESSAPGLTLQVQASDGVNIGYLDVEPDGTVTETHQAYR